MWWTWKSRRRIGRPTVHTDIRTLIRTMAQANPRWGAPLIHGELLKLGIDVCQMTVVKYMRRWCQCASPKSRPTIIVDVGALAGHPTGGA
jgi:putative transposase